ncbi:MAG: hypothetical protein Q7T80_09325 [Methanoregula sp.]|nr:hypothetical protein [Methanoregula sp.]
MAGRSPKRNDTTPKSRVIDKKNVKADSDYRLVIVLLAAIALAIAIIFTIMLTTR